MKIYLLGIGGTMMGNGAVLLKQMGHEVKGVDNKLYPPMSDVLDDASITYREGYCAVALQAEAPDVVVVGNVISRGNEELEWLMNQSDIDYMSLPELLDSELLSKRTSVVIAGTHGKTTTTAMAVHALSSWSRNPGYLVGGVLPSTGSGVGLGGQGSPFVIEGDEYDTVFYDKRSKFFHYSPDILVINNLEFDHADIFRDLEDIRRSFNYVTRIVPSEGAIVVNGDDPELAWVKESVTWTSVYQVGFGGHNDLAIKDYTVTPLGTEANLVWQGSSWGVLKLPTFGEFNLQNAATACLAAALSQKGGSVTDWDLTVMATFQPVKRRQELLHCDENEVVVEDFGHHPTAISGTVKALKAAYPDRKTLLVFEPRSYTMTTNVHQARLAEAFAAADEIMVGAIHREARIPEHQRWDKVAIQEELASQGKGISYYNDNQHILNDLKQSYGGNRLVIFMSNGGFGGIMQQYVASIPASSTLSA